MPFPQTLQLIDVEVVWPLLERAATRYVVDGRKETVDNIRQECINKKALCFASRDGAVVLSLTPNRNGKEFDLWVLLAVGWGPCGVVERNESWLIKTARELDASRIVFKTIRKGWSKILNPNWRYEDGKYIREV